MKQVLPELFEIIIQHDAERPGAYQKVVPIGIVGNIRLWRKRRNELTVGAQNYIKKQRGTGGAGASG